MNYKYHKDKMTKNNMIETGKESILLNICALAETVIVLILFVNASNGLMRILLSTCYLIFLLVLISYMRKMNEVNEIMAQKLEAESKAANAEIEKKKQQLMALENQINPHFLYNTLDTFRGVAIENEQFELSDMIEALSEMFKYSIKYDTEMVNVNAELNYLMKYMKLQQLRAPGRFEYKENINCTPEQLLLEQCPRFVLQPIVENSIRHGLYKTGGGCITVTMEIRSGDFYIIVEDNGCGMEQEDVIKLNEKINSVNANKKADESETHGGIGLMNVNRRIKMFCGELYGLNVISVKNVGTQIEICLPLYEEAKEDFSKEIHYDV